MVILKVFACQHASRAECLVIVSHDLELLDNKLRRRGDISVDKSSSITSSVFAALAFQFCIFFVFCITFLGSPANLCLL